jgi:hypothetical protein
MNERRIEYSSTSPRSTGLDGLRSLAEHAGLPLSRVMELANGDRLTELFCAETRSLAYKNGVRIPLAELRRSLAKEEEHSAMSGPISGRQALVEMEARRPSRLDGRTALAELNAKRRGW